MPLQVFTQALQLPDPVVRADEPAWLFSETVNLQGITALFVYRSTWLRDTDAGYAGVLSLLDRHTAELIYRWVMDDPGMVFAQGEILIYLLHDGEPTAPTDPGAKLMVRMIREWGEPVPAQLVADEIRNRLAQQVLPVRRARHPLT